MSASNHSSIKNKTLKRVPVKLVSDPDEDDSQHQGGHLWSEGTHRLLGMQVSCPKTVGRRNCFIQGFVLFVCFQFTPLYLWLINATITRKYLATLQEEIVESSF